MPGSGEHEPTLGWKVFGGLSAIVAAIVARKVVTATWKLATGSEPPSNPEDPAVTWAEAAGWAVASGVAVGLARLIAQRQAARTWQKASGKNPPGLRAAG